MIAARFALQANCAQISVKTMFLDILIGFS